ncbi:TPA: AAA family ATPase [Burkholderia vietnamiensis]|nr:AAA family ATPase [Burkholderia vietnamiensis]
MIPGYKVILNDAEAKDYQRETIKYWIKSFTQEIQKEFPDVDVNNADLDDPKFKHIIDRMPFKPHIGGDLAVTLGLSGKVLTVPLYEAIFAGYLPAEYLPEDSHLADRLIPTPKGIMLPLSNTPSGFDEHGEYKFDGQRRAALEFLTTEGKRLGIDLTARHLAHPEENIYHRYQACKRRVYDQHLLPRMLMDASVRVEDGNGGMTKKGAMEMLYIDFFHNDERSEGIHLHGHLQIMNTAMTKDGRLVTLTTDEIGQERAIYDAIYVARMKEELENEFGFNYEKVLIKADEFDEFLEDDEKNIVEYDLAKEYVPEEVVQHFSVRSKEIANDLKDSGLNNTANARAIAQKSSRDDKTEKSPSELLAKWQVEFKSLGFVPKDIPHVSKINNIAKLSGEMYGSNFYRKFNSYRIEDRMEAKEAMFDDEGNVVKARKEKQNDLTSAQREIIQKGWERKHKEVAFRKSQFIGHVIKQVVETCNADRAEEIANEMFEEQCSIYLPKDRLEYFEPFLHGTITDPVEYEDYAIKFRSEARFITNDMKDMAEGIQRMCLSGKENKSWLVDSCVVARHIRKYEKEHGFLLSGDQREYIEKFFSEPGTLFSAQGIAGGGKTTATEIIVKILEEKNIPYIGISAGNRAAKGLGKGCGMDKKNVYNVAKLSSGLRKNKIKLQPNTVIFWDEAGMSSTADFHAIMKAAEDQRVNMKMALIGEDKQLPPINAGNSFTWFNENFATVKMTTIQRQKSDQMKENVGKLQGGLTEEALKELDDMGKINISKTQKDAMSLLVERFVADPRDTQDKIIIAAMNADNESINLMLKKKLQELGKLPKTGQLAVACSDGITREFGPGDRIMFFKSAEASDAFDRERIDNGTPATISGFQKNARGRAIALRLELDEIDPATKQKRVRFISLEKKPPAVKFGWSSSTHKSQGASLKKAFVYFNQGMLSANMTYVALSRHKEDIELFFSEQMKDVIKKKAGLLPVQKWQKDRMKKFADMEQTKVPKQAMESMKDANEYLAKAAEKYEEFKPHRLDAYAQFIAAAGKWDIKKDVSDYSALGEKGTNLLADIEMVRRIELEEHKAKTKSKKKGIQLQLPN